MASRYLTLKQERHDLTTELRSLDLSTEEGKARLGEIESRITQVDAELLAEEKRRELERTAPAVEPPSIPQVTHVHDRAEDQPWGYASFGMTEAAYVASRPSYGLAETNPRHPKNVYRTVAFGEFLQAVYRANTGQGVDPRLTYVSAAQGQGAAIGPDGGFLVRRTVQDQITLRMAAGSIFQLVRPIPLDEGSDGLELNMVDEVSRATGSRHGAVRGYWIDEGDPITASRVKFRKYNLRVKGLAALGYATNSLLRNARALGDVMTQAFADELRFLTEAAIIAGQGAGQPRGVITWGARVTQPAEAGQAPATVVYENLSNMWSRLLPSLRSSAVWLCNTDVEPQLDRLAIVAGVGALEPRFVTYGPDGVLRIKGRPVVPVEYCPTLGVEGDIVLTSFDDYGFIEVPIEMASSMHVAFITNEMAFRVIYYVDGEPYLRQAIQPFQGLNTLSSIVTLAAR
jgi:HK97 family phage major capsid protein